MPVRMRVMVTGAQGFVGRYVIARWLMADPDAVLLGVGRSAQSEAFTHPATRGETWVPAPLPDRMARTLSDPRYRYAAIDIRNRPRLMETLRAFRPQVIIHLATVLRDGDPTVLMQSNVEGTANLMYAIALSGAGPRVVLGSTGAIYGRPIGLPLSETTPVGPPMNLYSASRRAAEEAAGLVADEHGLELCIARLFNPVGPGQDERHLSAHLAHQVAWIADGDARPEITVGPLDTTRDFHDVRDAADAIRMIALRGEAGAAYNVASGVETPTRALLERLLASAGLTEQVEVRSTARRPADVSRHVADISSLERLGFTSRFSWALGITDLLRWYRAEVAQAVTQATAEPEVPEPIEVSVQPRWDYTVEVEPGLLQAVPAKLRARYADTRMVVLTDSRVETLYGRSVLAGLQAQGIDAHLIALPEGEGSKAPGAYWEVIERLNATGFQRRSLLLCLGGGMITDVGGFIAATYMRGVPYINLPTTLLAQHDSAIGGKVALNTPWAKNFVGAFHHPVAVYADPTVLVTLDRRNLAAGIAEAIKVALTGDGTLFSLLERGPEALVERRDPLALARIVRRAARQKARLLHPDPYETDLGRALNLGHTLAHPLETEMAYAGLLHGEAVAYGLALATEVGRARGVCSASVAERIHNLLRLYALPPPVPLERQRAALARLREIRMVRGGWLNFVVPVASDQVTIMPDVSVDELAAAMEAISTLAEAA